MRFHFVKLRKSVRKKLHLKLLIIFLFYFEMESKDQTWGLSKSEVLTESMDTIVRRRFSLGFLSLSKSIARQPCIQERIYTMITANISKTIK